MSPELVKAALWTLEHTPAPFARALAACYLRLADYAMPEWRRDVLSDLERTRFPGSPQILAGIRHSIARGMVLFARIPSLTPERLSEWLVIDGLHHYYEAHQRKRGVIFVSGHLGHWELAAVALGWICPPVLTVVRSHSNSAINEILALRRSHSGNALVTEDKAARAVVRALRNNENVCIAADFPPRSGRGVWIDFLGVPAWTSTAVARIAALTGAAVIPGFPIWSKNSADTRFDFLSPSLSPVTQLKTHDGSTKQ